MTVKQSDKAPRDKISNDAGPGGGGILHKRFAGGVRPEPYFSQNSLRFSISYFRPDRKINTTLHVSKIVHGSNI